MAKKKTIDLRSLEPTPVPAGDVNIIYNGTRIAGFSEDTESTLKTGGTRVEHDIAVNYTKPRGTVLPSISITLNTANPDIIFETNPVVKTLANGNMVYVNADSGVLTDADHYIPAENSTGDDPPYQYRFILVEETDIFTITINGEPVPFSSDFPVGYTYTKRFTEYNTPITIVISDKQV